MAGGPTNTAGGTKSRRENGMRKRKGSGPTAQKWKGGIGKVTAAVTTL